MVNSQQGEIQLSDDQANQSSFPPNCPVYILYDDDDGIDAQGIVHSIILRRNPTTRAYTECYKINVKCKDDNGDFYSREDIVDFSQLRYRHGCHVTLVMKNNGEALANHGKVLGVISNASVNNKASGKPNQYWYCVQEVGKTRRTHHKVLPEQLKYHHVLGNEVNAKVEEDDDNENVALVTEPSSNIDDNVGEGSPRAVPVQIDLCNDRKDEMSSTSLPSISFSSTQLNYEMYPRIPRFKSRLQQKEYKCRLTISLPNELLSCKYPLETIFVILSSFSL